MMVGSSEPPLTATFFRLDMTTRLLFDPPVSAGSQTRYGSVCR
jgi:hypothetical protein